MSTLEKDKVGIFNYTLTNEQGEVLDSSQGHPMPYLHGYGNIIPGLEKELEGKTTGDRFSVVIPPEEAYGVFDENAHMSIHRNQMPAEDFEKIQVGSQVYGRTEDGQPIPLFVTQKEGDYVHLTYNHPLAGMILTFDVEIMGIRDALAIELEHGHPHGIDGSQSH
ncbi:MAG: peptidylprolyl isomerase [Proteobacteria bacterium]|nr:peptidylprolyl isomerase [Pseudomonadota bacterium]